MVLDCMSSDHVFDVVIVHHLDNHWLIVLGWAFNFIAATVNDAMVAHLPIS